MRSLLGAYQDNVMQARALYMYDSSYLYMQANWLRLS